jgi:RNAse (barnase) inhibitor barstar
MIVKLDTRGIHDWKTFHDMFARAFGFPNFYGRNMNAWIDCMTSLDDPAAQMTKVHVSSGNVVVLELEHVDDFARRCPQQYAAVVECAAFVNWRRIDIGDPPVLVLSFHKHT